MEKYGFVYLRKHHTEDSFRIHSYGEKLFETIIDCVQEAKQINLCRSDEPGYVLKIAYFKVLNNHEIVKEMHA